MQEPQYTERQPVRTRAGKACQRCHEKKIKCDRQSKKDPHSEKCHNCVVANSNCHLLVSRRGRKKRPILQAPGGLPGPPASPSPVRRTQKVQPFAGSPGEGPSQANSNTVPLSLSSSVPAVTSITIAPRNSVPGPIQRSSSILSLPNTTTPFDTSAINPGIPTPGASSSTTDGAPRQHASYLGETGCMQIFRGDAEQTDVTTGEPLLSERYSPLDNIPDELMQSYLETYFKYIDVWCPVLDKEPLQSQAEAPGSPMFRHALALCGTQLRPPLISHAQPSDHYKRAKGIFYADYEDNPISQISAVMMFYWYSPGPSNFVNLDNNWWWIGTAIRLAQEVGLHREPIPGQAMCAGETLGLRRRIWWTLYARDRIVALAQGRPTIIDQDFCDLQMVSLDDFPNPQDINSSIFVHWVQIWDIAGKINKELHRRKDIRSKASLARQMINWVQSLPSTLQLPFSEQRSLSYNRDVYYLHLCYLTVVTLFHLTKGEGSIPKASRSAIAAASCIARIFREYLARGSIRFMGCDAVWFVTVALLALLHARRIAGFTKEAENDIALLRVALKQLATFWYSGRLFDRGIDRILEMEPSVLIPPPCGSGANVGMEYLGLSDDDTNKEDTDSNGDSCWMDYFPYVTAETSPLIATMMVNSSLMMPFPEMEWPVDVTSQLQDLFSGLDGFDFTHW